MRTQTALSSRHAAGAESSRPYKPQGRHDVEAHKRDHCDASSKTCDLVTCFGNARRAHSRATNSPRYDRLGSLTTRCIATHSAFGIKQARGKLAVPTANVKRGASGVAKSQRPTTLDRSFRKGDSIFQRYGGKKNPRIRKMYTLKPTVIIKPDVPFVHDFRGSMRSELVRALPAAMAKAMKSKRRR